MHQQNSSTRPSDRRYRLRPVPHDQIRLDILARALLRLAARDTQPDDSPGPIIQPMEAPDGSP